MEVNGRAKKKRKIIQEPKSAKKGTTKTWVEDPELLKGRQALPIWEYKDQIRAALRGKEPGSDSLVTVIVGETGSGKSTQVPQFLAQEEWCQPRIVKVPGEDDKEKETEVAVGGMIAITEPRRVAATTLAVRVAREAGSPLLFGGGGGGEVDGKEGKGRVEEGKSGKGKGNGERNGEEEGEGEARGKGGGPNRGGLVGYSVRFDHKVPRGAKIKYMTEGMLLQELLRDPNLRAYSAVVVDEIHERSIDVDLIAGFLRQLTSNLDGRGGVPLRIVIMSATAEVDPICNFFSRPSAGLASSLQSSSPGTEKRPPENGGKQQSDSVRPAVLRIKGRQYPVAVQHTSQPVADLQAALVSAVLELNKSEPLPGDILAFLTGQEEIEAAQRLIEAQALALPSNIPKIKVFPLYGQLSLEAQHAAFQKIKTPMTRKVVLATNIAETSVTVPGVRFVVDCGKAKVKQFRPTLGLESLLAKPISKSSAVQRTGRAGREGPGKCVRLYTEPSFVALEPRDQPEMLRIEVLGAVLAMKACGVDDIHNFPLMDRPDDDTVRNALFELLLLGAISSEGGSITPAGRKLARFPLSARLGTVLLAASEPGYDCVLEAIDVISCLTSGEDIFHRLYKDDEEETKQEDETKDGGATGGEPGPWERRKELMRREGDLITCLTTMRQYTSEHADRAAWCRALRIRHRNMRMAVSIRRQLRQLCAREGLLGQAPPPDPQPFEPPPPDVAEALLRCFVRGFVRRAALLQRDGSYLPVGRGRNTVAIHPSSCLHGQGKREAILFLEHVYTTKSYAKKVSAIKAQWIEEELGRS